MSGLLGATTDTHELPAVARQIKTLGDMVVRTARYMDMQPSEDVLTRRHVIPMLECIKRAGGKLRRKELKAHMALEEANLSRLIVLLEASGLISRSTAGRESMIALTGEGSRCVSETPLVPELPDIDGALWDDASEVAVSIVDTSGNPTANSSFERVVGLSPALALDRLPSEFDHIWTDIQTAEDKWIRCIQVRPAGAAAVQFWVDVSDLKRMADRSQQRAINLEAQLAHLRADREAILARLTDHRAFQSALVRRVRALSASGGVARGAALTRNSSLMNLRHADLLNELIDIQSSEIDYIGLDESQSNLNKLDASEAYEKILSIARLFSDYDLRPELKARLRGVKIDASKLMDTFKGCVIRGDTFSRLNVSDKGGAVVFTAATKNSAPTRVFYGGSFKAADGSFPGGAIDQLESDEAAIEVAAPIQQRIAL